MSHFTPSKSWVFYLLQNQGHKCDYVLMHWSFNDFLFLIIYSWQFMVENLIVLIVGIKVISNLTIFLDYDSGMIIPIFVRYILRNIYLFTILYFAFYIWDKQCITSHENYLIHSQEYGGKIWMKNNCLFLISRLGKGWL